MSEQILDKATCTAQFLHTYFNYQIPENDLLTLCTDLEKDFEKDCLNNINRNFHIKHYKEKLSKGWLADYQGIVQRNDFGIHILYENEKIKISSTWKKYCLSKDESISNYKKWKHYQTDLFPYSIDFSDAVYMEYWDFTFVMRYGWSYSKLLTRKQQP